MLVDWPPWALTTVSFPQVPVRTEHGLVGTMDVMSAQELVVCLCREGEKHLALGEPPLATAYYLAAFSCHAPSAVRSVQAALAEARGAPVVATLEAWCRGDSQIPAIHWDGMAVVSLTGTLASAFLGALCPDHPATVLHLLAGLLAHGRHEEVVQRCNALLDAHSQQTLELRLTRAMACVLSGKQMDDGLATYLEAFATSADRTVTFIRTHQQSHLPTLVSTLQDYILGHPEATDSAGQQEINCQRLLTALDPGGTWSDALSPEALLHRGRFEACVAACSRDLQSESTSSRPQGRTASQAPSPPTHTHTHTHTREAGAISPATVMSCLWWERGLGLSWGYDSDKKAGHCPYRAPKWEANKILALKTGTRSRWSGKASRGR
jgi:hypothetical protein